MYLCGFLCVTNVVGDKRKHNFSSDLQDWNLSALAGSYSLGPGAFICQMAEMG